MENRALPKAPINPTWRISDKCAERIVQECIKLIEHMLYGNAMIAFHKQDGTFCLERGTLVGYEKFFHREFNITAQQESIIYWSEEQKGSET